MSSWGGARATARVSEAEAMVWRAVLLPAASPAASPPAEIAEEAVVETRERMVLMKEKARHIRPYP